MFHHNMDQHFVFLPACVREKEEQEKEKEEQEKEKERDKRKGDECTKC